MSQRQVLMVFGVWVAVLPFLGFPMDWEKVLACLSGLLIVFLAYRLKPDGSVKKDPVAMPYAEHRSVPAANGTTVSSTDTEAPAGQAAYDEALINGFPNTDTK